MSIPTADVPETGERKQSKLAPLRPELEEWYKTATVILAVNPPSHVMRLPATKTTWLRINDRMFDDAAISRVVFVSQTYAALKQLDAYHVLEEAARKNSAIGPMFGHQIGSYVFTHPFEFEEFAFAAIPTPEGLLDGDLGSFEEIFADLEEQVSDFSRYTTTCFLQGIDFAQQRIELESDLVVEAVTDDEIIAALECGLLKDPLFAGRTPFYTRDTSRFALKKQWQHPRILGGEPDPTVSNMMQSADTSKEAERLIQCVGVLTHEPVFVTGTVTRQAKHTFIIPNSGAAELYSFWPVPRQMTGISLDNNQCHDIKKLWSLSEGSATSTQLRAFGLAIRRLGYGSQRIRPEDRLLDVYIAAEAFYLAERAGNPKERGELSYRLAHRAAIWADGTMPGWTRGEVFRQIRSGYNVRSAVAHGGTPDPKDVKIKDERVLSQGGQVLPDELYRFVQCVEDIVRAGLYKAYQQAMRENGQMNVDWDTLLLGELKAGYIGRTFIRSQTPIRRERGCAVLRQWRERAPRGAP
jgi:hypothetical protein